LNVEPVDEFAPLRENDELTYALEASVAESDDDPSKRRCVAGFLYRALRSINPTPNETLASLRQASSTADRHAHVGDNDTLCPLVVARNDNYLFVAAYFAAMTNRRFIILDEWDSLTACVNRAAPNHVTIFSSPDALGQSTLFTFAGMRNTGTLGRVPFGIMTARSVQSLTFLILKTLIYPHCNFGPDLIVVDADLSRHASRNRLRSWQDMDHTAVRELVKSTTNILSMTVHGDNIDANLNEGVLCGKSSHLNMLRTAQEGKNDTERYTTHTCLIKDLCRRNTAGTLSLIPMDRVRSRFCFSEACSGISLGGGMFPRQLSLALSAIEGWNSAYVSSLKAVRRTPLGPILVNALLASGYSFGQATNIFNTYHTTITGDVISYLLIGDPSATAGKDEPHHSDAITWNGDDDQTCFHLIEIVGRTVRIDLEGIPASVWEKRQDLSIEVLGILPHPDSAQGFAIIVPDTRQDRLSLWMFSAGVMRFRRIDLRIGLKSKRRMEQPRLSAFRTNRLFLDRLTTKICSADGLRPTVELARQGRDLHRVCKASRLLNDLAPTLLRELENKQVPLQSPNDVDELMTRFRSAVDKCDRMLARSWPRWKMGHYFAPFYDGYLFPNGPETPANVCPYCGEDCYAITMNTMARDTEARTITHCIRCGVISDRPEHETLMRIAGPHICSPGDTIIQECIHTNSELYEKKYYACITFEGSLPWMKYTARPELQSCIVPPQSEHRHSFEITIEKDTAPGMYYIVAPTFHNLGIQVSCKPFVVRD